MRKYSRQALLRVACASVLTLLLSINVLAVPWEFELPRSGRTIQVPGPYAPIFDPPQIPTDREPFVSLDQRWWSIKVDAKRLVVQLVVTTTLIGLALVGIVRLNGVSHHARPSTTQDENHSEAATLQKELNKLRAEHEMVAGELDRKYETAMSEASSELGAAYESGDTLRMVRLVRFLAENAARHLVSSARREARARQLGLR